MNKEKVELIRKTIKELEEKRILLLDTMIIFELDCQLEEEISDDDYIKLYNEIEYAYLKLEGVALESVVRCALDHMEDIINENEDFSLRDEACWYE